QQQAAEDGAEGQDDDQPGIPGHEPLLERWCLTIAPALAQRQLPATDRLLRAVTCCAWQRVSRCRGCALRQRSSGGQRQLALVPAVVVSAHDGGIGRFTD